MLTFNEYQAIVEQAPIMIWRSDSTAACDYFNQTWLAFTGRSMDHELGNGWAEGVHREDYDRCLQIYLSAFEARQPFEMQYRLKRHDGVYRWIFDRGVPYLDPEGRFSGYIGSCVDVTEKVEGEQAILRANELELRTLRGLLPICSGCKKIRNDTGQWERIEVYIRDRSMADFSHGICPTCMSLFLTES